MGGQSETLPVTVATMQMLLYGWAPLREDNPRALASRLSSVQTQNHTITCLLHKYAFVLYALRDIWRQISMKGAIMSPVVLSAVVFCGSSIEKSWTKLKTRLLLHSLIRLRTVCMLDSIEMFYIARHLDKGV